MPLVQSQDQLRNLVQEIRNLSDGRKVAIDTETNAEPVYTSQELRGISFAYNEATEWYVSVSHPDSPNLDITELLLALEETNARHVMHNSPFDQATLKERKGWHPRVGNTTNTLLLSWLVDENVQHGLKPQGAMFFGVDATAEKRHLAELKKGRKRSDIYTELRQQEEYQCKGCAKDARAMAALMSDDSKKDWATFTAEDMAAYGAQDARLTYDLDDIYTKRPPRGAWAKTWPTKATIDREYRVEAALFRMMELGVLVDEEKIHEVRAANEARMAEIQPTFGDVNMNSPKQLAELIYGTWGLPVIKRSAKTGAPSTDHDTIEELEVTHGGMGLPFDDLLEYRKLSKAVGTYYNGMIRSLDPYGRIHTSFCQTCTVTGRFSSSDPNLQNIPREDTNPEVKSVFRAADGYELWEYDLHSAELYVGASVAGDDEMAAALDTPGRDFHDETAIGIFGDKIGHHRQWAKNANYGIPYGIGAKKFALYIVKGTGQPVGPAHIRQAKEIIDGHKRLWPKTHAAIKRLTRYAEQEGVIPLHVPGRYRHFKGPGYHVPGYNAFNAAVQGGVAELMKDLMVEIEVPVYEQGARPVLQVHDSFWIEVPAGMGKIIGALLQDVLDQINPFTMRLTIDSKPLWSPA